PTAYFDGKNRVLHCPIWDNMDSDLYDLLIGHEVSHCLNTPTDEWYHSITESCAIKHEHTDYCFNQQYKFCLNVCEDARIERLIKAKFPGLRAPFAKAYKELYERDFFGIRELKSLDKLNLADRINLQFKIGSHLA